MAEILPISISPDHTRFLLQVTSRTIVQVPIYHPHSAKVIRDICKAREEVPHAIISTPAAPTQRQVEDLLKAYMAGGGQITKGKINAPADLSLEDLGLL